MLALSPLFFVVALLYSMVGFGGGSSYIALLAAFGVSYELIPKISLLCNIIVVSGGCWHYHKKELLDKNLAFPFLVSSIPLSFVGGSFPVSEKWFYILLSVSLLLSGLRILFVRPREASEIKRPSNFAALIVGGSIGLLSGMVGIGGGIFLSPILIMLGWARSKNAAGVATLFILLNSISGLIGQLSKGQALGDAKGYILLFLAVLIGGQIGSRIGTREKTPYKIVQLKASSKRIKLTKINALGESSGHWTRNIVLLNNKIYISIGSRGNIDIENNLRATIQEFNIKTNEQKTFATGLRNPIGIDLHPITKKIYTVVNERDGMGDELVPDYFTQVEKGDFFGWPFFYLGNNIQPNITIPEEYKNSLVKKPDVLFKSHSGPIDLIFYNKNQFPEKFYGDAFVALHGSWNSSKPSGYMVVKIPFKNNKPLGYYESFVTGFWVTGSKRANVCGRPAGLGITKNGSLLISDDLNNTIYHVEYTK